MELGRAVRETAKDKAAIQYRPRDLGVHIRPRLSKPTFPLKGSALPPATGQESSDLSTGTQKALL